MLSLKHRVPDDKLFFNEKVISIDIDRKIVSTNKRDLYYDNLISTIPFPALLKATHLLYDESVYSWNQVLVFNLGFDSKGNDITNNWVYFPDKELSFYRVGYYDNIFNTERMSLYVELGFTKDAYIDVERWFVRVMDDLKKSGIVTSQALISHSSIIMNPAYVHITEHSLHDVIAKKKILEQHGIYSIGRYGSWTYCSIEDGMVEAKKLSAILDRHSL